MHNQRCSSALDFIASFTSLHSDTRYMSKVDSSHYAATFMMDLDLDLDLESSWSLDQVFGVVFASMEQFTEFMNGGNDGSNGRRWR